MASSLPRGCLSFRCGYDAGRPSREQDTKRGKRKVRCPEGEEISCQKHINPEVQFARPTSSRHWTHPLFPSLSHSEGVRSIREMKNGVQLAEYFLPLVGVNSSL
ncbi:hypothetical protein JOB18_005288 [Solea senegalensis]|nr:hypothetical protein JOB18_005288 [Solea senegalensis]